MGIREAIAICWRRIPPASLRSRVGMTGADVRSGIRNPHPNVAKGGDVRMGYPVFFLFQFCFFGRTCSFSVGNTLVVGRVAVVRA